MSGRQQDLGAVISSRDGKGGKTDVPGKESREKVCKVCESDRRTVTHLMKEYVGGQRVEREKREKVLGAESDELDWTEQVMRKRSGRKGGKVKRREKEDARRRGQI